MNAHTSPQTLQQSSSKIPIEPRKVRFDFDDLDNAFYYNGNPFISAMWVALSASFPLGESEFIKSVKFFEDKIRDPKLREEVQQFAQQEAHHSLQHRKVNALFTDLGYNVSMLEDFFKKKLEKRAINWSRDRRLARTVAAEHVTATMAHHALTHPERMQYFPDSFRELFLWHAIEEIEHKSVAFDVYQHCVARPQLLNWEYRYFVYFEFPFNVYMATKRLIKELGYTPNKQEKADFKEYLFGDGGLVSGMKKEYLSFTKKGFHPWRFDDSDLVNEWKVKLEPHFV